MAPPLSQDLPLSHALRDVMAAATSLAEGEGTLLQSSHLLFALYTVDARVSEFLLAHRAPRLNERLRQSARQLHEPHTTLDRILDRSKRLATQCAPPHQPITVDTMHLLAAMLRESRSSAYKLLERGGLKVSGIRMKTRALLSVPPVPARVEPSDDALPLPAEATPQRARHATGSIGFHPGLSYHVRGAERRAAASSTRAVTVPERSSPVHPALHQQWLRSTPAQGLPALERDIKAPAVKPPSELRLDDDLTAPLEPHASSVHKSLKERFAELKQQARKRRQRVDPPATLSREKMPPSVRRDRAIRRAPRLGATPEEPICDDPLGERALKAKRPVDPLKRARPLSSPAPAEAPDHLTEALKDAKDTTRSLAARLFGKSPRGSEPPSPGDADYEAPAAQAPQALAATNGPDARLASLYRLDPEHYPVLSKVGRNLTEEAALQRLDRAIGRDEEITALIDILGKRRSNNPMLIGEPGVGKTAIVEGLAHQFVALAQRGARLGERAIVEIELGRVLAGTHLRGALAERLSAIKDEVRRADGRVIVFLDEIHGWLNAGQSGDGSDAAGELKTALARGQFPCIGATTRDEYTQFIEADAAFRRRFQPVQVEEPSLKTAVTIAHGVREHYERHHGVTYADAAIEAAVRLSQRYIHDRRLPDKAINVLDLAGSRAAREARAYVRRTDIAHVVAEMASLPPERLTLSDRARFLEIERELGRAIIGHEHVVRATAEVLRRNYAGFRSKRPIGSLLFLGPTGVGKTELVKALADFLFHDREAIARLDMSEFMEAHSVSRLIGAPPGYVGHEQGGQLTETVRKRPYQVVLLDEIEKAHPDVLNLLLQLLDEGRLTDGRGRAVDFSQALVVMTSNLGSEVFESFVAEFGRQRIGFGGLVEQPARPERQAELSEAVREKAREHFTPELWNRIDERLVFLPLREDEVAQIAVLQLEESARHLEEEEGIQVEFSDEVIAHLIRHGGYDRRLGARPMRQTIQRRVESVLSTMVLSNRLKRGDRVQIDVDADDELIFSV